MHFPVYLYLRILSFSLHLELCLPKCWFPNSAKLTHGRDRVSKRGMCKQLIDSSQGFSNYSRNFGLKCLVSLRHDAGRGQAMQQSSQPTPDAPFNDGFH